MVLMGSGVWLPTISTSLLRLLEVGEEGRVG